MRDNILDTKVYNKILEVVRRVAKVYGYEEVNKDFDKSDITFEKLFRIEGDFMYMYASDNIYLASEMLAMMNTISRGLGLKDIVCLTKSSAIKMMIEKLQIKIGLNDDVYASLNLKCENDYFEVSVIERENGIIIMKTELPELVRINKLEGKKLVAEDMTHIFFVTDGEDAKIEAFKQMNIARIGGLTSYMLYDDDMELANMLVEKKSPIYMVFIDDESLENNMCIVRDMNTQEDEEINVNDVYPYIINNINKKSLGACASCKEK